MRLLVDRLTATPERSRFEASESWLRGCLGALPEPGARVLEPPVFELEARCVGEDILIEGRLDCVLEFECGRCLKRYRHALRDDFRLLLEPVSEQTPSDPECAEVLAESGICLGDELEVGWYRGKEIELDRFLAEVFSLALPAQPLCREDCEGLCPHCGADRSQQSCDCVDLKPSSPFAVLAALRGGGPGRSS